MLRSGARAANSARRIAAVFLTFSWGLACKQILDVPQDPEDVVEAGKKYCTCPGLIDQGPEVTGRCDASFGEEGEPDYAHALAFAEAGCTSCPFQQVGGANVPDLEELGRCYGEITGADPGGAACSTHSDCTTFACCATEIQYGVSSGGKGLLSTNVCCDACLGCAATDGVDLLSKAGVVLCAESIALFDDYATCLCEAHTAGDACGAASGGPCGTGATFCASGACRDCLLSEYGDLCQGQVDACRNDIGRSVLGQ